MRASGAPEDHGKRPRGAVDALSFRMELRAQVCYWIVPRACLAVKRIDGLALPRVHARFWRKTARGARPTPSPRHAKEIPHHEAREGHGR